MGAGAGPQVAVAPVGSTLWSNDSPASRLNPNTLPAGATPLTWFRVDSFTITAMYNPFPTDPNQPGNGVPHSIWVPVGALYWSWGAYAQYMGGGAWAVPANAAQEGLLPFSTKTQFGPTDVFPTWSYRKQDLDLGWH